MTDTSTEAVDRLCAGSGFEGHTAALVGTLRSLAAERDALKAEVERLREALDDMRGRFRLYAGWPDHNWGGHTDAALLAKADAALKGGAE